MFFSLFLFYSFFRSYFSNFPHSASISLSLCFRSVLSLFVFSSVPYRSPSADSGSTYMMNWAGTPAAQVPPRVRGDTTRGELWCSSVTCDTLLLCVHTWNSLHRLKWVHSPTAASNVISQCFIHNIGTRQDKYWSYSGGSRCTSLQITPHSLSHSLSIKKYSLWSWMNSWWDAIQLFS